MPSTNTTSPNRNGAALIVAMLCLLLTSMLSVTLVRTVLLQRERLEREEWQLQADWLVQAALQRATANLSNNPAYAGELWLPTASPDAPPIGQVDISVRRSSPDDMTGETDSETVIHVTVDVPNDPVDRVRITRAQRLTSSAASPPEMTEFRPTNSQAFP